MSKATFWILLTLTIVLVFAFGWGGPAIRFPLALGLIRIAFFVTEQVWARVRA